MNWIQAKTLADLQSYGSFKDVRRSIQNSLGERLSLKARSWKDLLVAVKHLQALTICRSSSSSELSEEVDYSTEASLYFKSEAARIIYALLNLDGELRLKELGIDRSHYKDSNKAKKWRNEIAKLIHPDLCEHPQSSLATNKLTELFESMIGR